MDFFLLGDLNYDYAIDERLLSNRPNHVEQLFGDCRQQIM